MLNVHWWKPGPGMANLGDEITSLLLSVKYNYAHRHTDFENADLVSTGSMLNMLFQHLHNTQKRSKEISIVGSGFMHPYINVFQYKNFLQYLKFYSVRGYLSRGMLPDNVVGKATIGDPGLLLSKVFSAQFRYKYRYGVILHHSELPTDENLKIFENLKSYRIIDFKTRDINEILSQMHSCEIVISQGLHGLVIADAYGIPNVWLDKGALHIGNHFKFYDYFSSISRPFDLKVCGLKSVKPGLVDRAVFSMKCSKLELIQENIDAAFRKALNI